METPATPTEPFNEDSVSATRREIALGGDGAGCTDAGRRASSVASDGDDGHDSHDVNG